jgi:hypothetical protein
MRFLLGAVACVCASAASIPTQRIYGNYVEARTADVFTGPCFANAEVGQVGNLAVFGWNVSKGAWDGVDLSGLSVVGVVRARHTLGDVYESAYPIKSVLIVDTKANMEQRLALQKFAKHMGGDLFENVVKVDYQPIRFTLKDDNVHSRAATLVAGDEARLQTRPIAEGDHICRNEEVWYPPLTKVEHAMPAATVAHSFNGDGLGTKWSSPDKRSAFVGTFVE